MTHFVDRNPSLETYWRSIILLGRNVASYKFALAKTLLEINVQSSLIRLDDLAVPFALNIAEHMKHNDKQITSQSSRFLEICRGYNRGETSQDRLRDETVKLGFNNVIDAFHIVSSSEVPRFFDDERKANGGIVLSDNFYRLLEGQQKDNLSLEVNSRWRLWETAISLDIKPNLIQVNADTETDGLFVIYNRHKRIDVTSSRDALNGYQKGKCFYCSREILIEQGHDNSCDVDHFFPDVLKQHDFEGIDQVWNLVLACRDCNRGASGKFERIVDKKFLEALPRSTTSKK